MTQSLLYSQAHHGQRRQLVQAVAVKAKTFLETEMAALGASPDSGKPWDCEAYEQNSLGAEFVEKLFLFLEETVSEKALAENPVAESLAIWNDERRKRMYYDNNIVLNSLFNLVSYYEERKELGCYGDILRCRLYVDYHFVFYDLLLKAAVFWTPRDIYLHQLVTGAGRPVFVERKCVDSDFRFRSTAAVNRVLGEGAKRPWRLDLTRFVARMMAHYSHCVGLRPPSANKGIDYWGNYQDLCVLCAMIYCGKDPRDESLIDRLRDRFEEKGYNTDEMVEFIEFVRKQN